MATENKYAVVERERRYLVSTIPAGVDSTRQTLDRYLVGTRLRLREVTDEHGTVVRKLSHRVRLTDDPGEVACTNFYVDDHEWAVLAALPARTSARRGTSTRA